MTIVGSADVPYVRREVRPEPVDVSAEVPKVNRRAALRSLESARTYAEWREAALAYDRARGLDGWRALEACPLYDHALVRRRLEELVALRRSGDDHGLLFALNEGIHGNLGGMGREDLYLQSAFGTKQLIIDYVDAVVEALHHLAEDADPTIPEAQKQDFFRRARICYGHTALMLSGSGSFFFFHIGVLRALVSEGLLPSVLSGSSGGALVAATLGTRPPEQWDSVLSVEHFHPFVLERERARPDANTSLRRKVLERNQQILEELIPDLTFEEAYRVSGLNINISVAPTDLHQSSRLLNAITSPHVFVREAVAASCALPGVFPPVTLMAKTFEGDKRPYLPDRRWIDGSLSDDLPAKRLSRLFGVNHYIVSQTNPHVLPFLTDEKLSRSSLGVLLHTGQRTLREWMNGGAAVLQRPLRASPQVYRAVHTFLSIINQDYLGDINVLPPRGTVNPFNLLAFRSQKDAQSLVQSGERATWPKIEMVRNQTKISRTLDRLVG